MIVLALAALVAAGLLWIRGERDSTMFVAIGVLTFYAGLGIFAVLDLVSWIRKKTDKN
jgi:hypothetical protein